VGATAVIGAALDEPPLPPDPPTPGWLGRALFVTCPSSSSPEQAIAVQIAAALASSQTIPERIELFSKQAAEQKTQVPSEQPRMRNDDPF
jgi:mannose/fructose/N-acetylgalactosamine-specific phosphotransferase system component IIC